ncbi:MAG: endonuclease/exonuclease/phosphatase family protein [Anaerolineae bacterium]
MKFAVMTFNVRGSYYVNDGLNFWPNRAELNVETIKKASPDIIGFQEMHPGNLATYLEQLQAYQFSLGPPTDKADVHDYNSIFWKADRFEFQDTGGFYLSETPETWSKSWDSVFVRGATWVKLLDKRNDTALLIFNTHLDHIGEQARVAGTRLLLQKMADYQTSSTPVILLGDFNCSPWVPTYEHEIEYTSTDASYRLIVEQGLSDTFLASGNIDSMSSNTFHGFEGDSYSALDHHMSWRLDWILTKDSYEYRVKTVGCEIIRDAKPPLYPSDHYPVLAQLVIEGK